MWTGFWTEFGEATRIIIFNLSTYFHNIRFFQMGAIEHAGLGGIRAGHVRDETTLVQAILAHLEPLHILQQTIKATGIG